MMKIVDKAAFEQIIAEGYTLVDFYADWCGPCRMLAPILESLDADYPNIDFIKVNVDNEEEIAVKYGIMSIPAVFLFKDGQAIDRFVGLQSKEDIIRFLKSAK